MPPLELAAIRSLAAPSIARLEDPDTYRWDILLTDAE